MIGVVYRSRLGVMEDIKIHHRGNRIIKQITAVSVQRMTPAITLPRLSRLRGLTA